jgi:hypothetical protein
VLPSPPSPPSPLPASLATLDTPELFGRPNGARDSGEVGGADGTGDAPDAPDAAPLPLERGVPDSGDVGGADGVEASDDASDDASDSAMLRSGARLVVTEPGPLPLGATEAIPNETLLPGFLGGGFVTLTGIPAIAGGNPGGADAAPAAAPGPLDTKVAGSPVESDPVIEEAISI